MPKQKLKLDENKTEKPIDPRCKFKPEFCQIAYNACAKNGADIKDLSVLFGVDEKTIYNWMRDFPDLKKAIISGRDEFDINRVERRLVDLAVGLEYEDTLVEQDESTGKVKVRQIKRQLPPNPTAIIFYLKNRQPDRWRDKIVNEVSGQLDISVELPNELKIDPPVKPESNAD